MDIWAEVLHVRLNIVSQMQSPMANVMYIWHLSQDFLSYLSTPPPPPPRLPMDWTEWKFGRGPAYEAAHSISNAISCGQLIYIWHLSQDVLSCLSTLPMDRIEWTFGLRSCM